MSNALVVAVHVCVPGLTVSRAIYTLMEAIWTDFPHMRPQCDVTLSLFKPTGRKERQKHKPPLGDRDTVADKRLRATIRGFLP